MNIKNSRGFVGLMFFLLIAINVQALGAAIENIPIDIKQRMHNNSWYNGCPVSLQQLAYVTVPYWGFDQAPHQGVLIVNKKIAYDVLAIFQEIYAAKFPIEKIRPIYLYAGNDNRSMADNNTSAFNCRTMADSSRRLSLHSYGVAIDINPLRNPYIRQNLILPPQARPYLDRDNQIAGFINNNTVVYQAFIRHGWSWGGDWQFTKDYAHFEKH